MPTTRNRLSRRNWCSPSAVKDTRKVTPAGLSRAQGHKSSAKLTDRAWLHLPTTYTVHVRPLLCRAARSGLTRLAASVYPAARRRPRSEPHVCSTQQATIETIKLPALFALLASGSNVKKHCMVGGTYTAAAISSAISSNYTRH